MKTVQDWFDIAVINPNCFGEESVKKWITAIQADAFADGERKGRIAGLRDASRMCSRADTYDTRKASGALDRAADRLECEEEAK